MICGALLVPTFCFANVRWAGDSLTTVPVPNSSTTCGFEDALSLMVTAPVLVPCTRGVKVAVIVQLPPGATLPWQVVFALNWLPLKLTDEIVNGDVPLFVSVAIIGALVVPISCVGKVTGVVGEKLTAPVLSRTITSLVPESGVIMSGLPSLLTSATVT